jgi:hypothetical protein
MKHPRVKIVKPDEPDGDTIKIPAEKLLLCKLTSLATSPFEVGGNSGQIEIRYDGSLSGRGFFLSSKFDWRIFKDETNVLVLVPTKRD